MDRLPLFDELRVARARAQEANLAAAHLRAIEGVWTSVALLLRQASNFPDLDNELPGSAIVETIADTWPNLADLQGEGPRPTQPYATQLRNRQSQLETARAALSPLAAESHDRHHDLHHLVNKQVALLEKAGASEVLAELRGWQDERVAIQQRLTSIITRMARMDPAVKMLASFETSLLREVERAASGEPRDTLRALTMADSLSSTIRLAFAEMELVARTPEPPDTTLTDPAAVTAELHRVRDGFSALREVVHAEFNELAAQRATLDTRTAELVALSTERTG